MATLVRPARLARRIAAAFLCAAVLWCIVTLGQEYQQTFELPLRVALPPGFSLARRPPTVSVEVRGNGWALMRRLIAPPPTLLLRPWMSDLERGGTIDVKEEQIAQLVKGALPDVQRLSYTPASMRLSVEPTITRRVALAPLAVVVPRDGFDVTNAPRLTPDSVTITGARSVLEAITEWPTDTGTFNDVHGPFTRWLAIGNPYDGMVTAQPERVEFAADVQQIAELEFPDIPLQPRITTRDTALRLTMIPERVRVLVRGGVRDLERLDPTTIRAYLAVVEGVDTAGVAEPRFILPLDLHLEIVSIVPERIRYRYRKIRTRE